jgi:hypothetical protein
LEQDRIMNSDMFAYRHEEYGEIKYLTSGIITNTSFGDLFLTMYIARDDHTNQIFTSLIQEGGDKVIRLASWPDKSMP